jgi:arylsulfatase A-like enzyme
MKWPGQIRPGTVVEQPVSFVDIAPTLMAAAGIPGPEGYRPDGISFLPAVMHGKELGRDTIYMEMGYARAVLKGKYHYVAFRLPESQLKAMEDGEHEVAIDHWGQETKGFTSMNAPYKPHMFEPDQLYDIEDDPFERHNLAGDPAYAGVLQEMKGELENYLSQFERPFPLEVPPFMETDAYGELVKARMDKILSGGRRMGGHDAERIMNLNLPVPDAE